MKIDKKDLRPEDLKKIFNFSEMLNAFSECKEYFINRSEKNLFFNKSIFSYFIKNILPYIGNVQNKLEILPVNEYKNFICVIKKKYPKLYEEEYLETTEHVFKDLSHPLYVLHNMCPFYEDELRSFKEHFQSFINNLLKFMLIYSLEIDNEPLFDNDFFIFVNNFFNNFTKYINKRDFIGLFQYLKEKFQSLKFPKKIRQYHKEILKNIEKMVNDMIEQKKRYLVFQNDDTKYIGAILKMIKDIDSHIIIFCRYITRLDHIFRFNNRNFTNKYYEISSRKFERKRFYELLKNHLSNSFPRLSRFLQFFILRFWEIRNIDAHEVIINFKYLRNKNLIIIPKTDKHKKILININKTLSDIGSYGQFINQINIHQNSPSDIEDITKMILE